MAGCLVAERVVRLGAAQAHAVSLLARSIAGGTYVLFLEGVDGGHLPTCRIQSTGYPNPRRQQSGQVTRLPRR